jgi:signal transduction histidine kinase
MMQRPIGKMAGEILLVDDNPIRLKLLMEMLGSRGYKVRPASSGRAALEAVGLRVPELILLDVKMPEMDGFEVCRRLKAEANTQDIPVIFISALNAPADQVRGFEAGGVDFITLPFSEQIVLARVETQLALARSRYSLEVSKQEAEAANRAKSTFLASMSHELRTPLNAILGFSEMLARDPEITDRQQEKINIINRSGEHLLAMINDVLDLSKIEAGRTELEPEVFNLLKLLEDIARMFELRAEGVDLRFNVEIAPNLAQTINADAGKLRQILINLLGNAVKFTHKGGLSLRARTVPVADDASLVALQLEVEDSGPGIAEGQQQSIFEPFRQVGHTPTHSKGTGLGLAISKSFAELMGGSISVQSVLGKGSLFCLELPVSLAEPADEVGMETVPLTVLGLKPDQPAWRILLVEDNIDNRLLLSGLLQAVGFDVREAEDGAQAIKQFQQWQPHFIWMDMLMPVMDGFEASRRIRALPGGDQVKIVALTASVFKEQRQSILQAGCDEVVHKPYQSHQIFSAMARQLKLEYLYQAPVKERKASQKKVDSKAIAALPQTVQTALSKAARELSIDDIASVLVLVRQSDPQLADGLEGLAQKYRFSELQELLKEIGD